MSRNRLNRLGSLPADLLSSALDYDIQGGREVEVGAPQSFEPAIEAFQSSGFPSETGLNQNSNRFNDFRVRQTFSSGSRSLIVRQHYPS